MILTITTWIANIPYMPHQRFYIFPELVTLQQLYGTHLAYTPRFHDYMDREGLIVLDGDVQYHKMMLCFWRKFLRERSYCEIGRQVIREYPSGTRSIRHIFSPTSIGHQIAVRLQQQLTDTYEPYPYSQSELT